MTLSALTGDYVHIWPIQLWGGDGVSRLSRVHSLLSLLTLLFLLTIPAQPAVLTLVAIFNLRATNPSCLTKVTFKVWCDSPYTHVYARRQYAAA
jgi:hypothetical protein